MFSIVLTVSTEFLCLRHINLRRHEQAILRQFEQRPSKSMTKSILYETGISLEGDGHLTGGRLAGVWRETGKSLAGDEHLLYRETGISRQGDGHLQATRRASPDDEMDILASRVRKGCVSAIVETHGVRLRNIWAVIHKKTVL